MQQYLKDYVYSGWVIFCSQKSENITLLQEIDKTEVKMEIKFTQKCQNLQELMSSSIQKSESAKQILNIIIKQLLKANKWKEIGLRKNFFDVSKRIRLEDQRLEIWRGFYTSTEYFQSGPKLTIDCCSKILRLDTTLEYIRDLQKQGKSQEQIKRELQYSSVVAYYGTHRTYQIHDIIFDMTPLSKFETPKGEITFVEYFTQQYKQEIKSIKDLKQPLLLYYKKQRNIDQEVEYQKIYLLPELTRMTGLTDRMRNDRNCMKSLIDQKSVRPKQRLEQINQITEQLQNFINKSNWNIQLEQSDKIDALLLKQPRIKSGNKQIQHSIQGEFQIQGAIFESPIIDNNWVLIYGDVYLLIQQIIQQEQKDYDSAEKLAQTLKKSSSRYGIQIGEPEYISIQSTTPQQYENQLISYFVSRLNQLDYLSKNKPLIVVSLLKRKNNQEIYKAIKKACYILSKNVVPSQNVLMETLQKNIMSICSKILFQMATKMNKRPWLVEPVINLPQNTMLIGADVHHKKGKKSIIGFCATLNKTFSNFYSRAAEQASQQNAQSEANQFINYQQREIIKSIGQFVQEGLLAYFANNNQLPENIIFFRDGVGDSQIEEVREIEVKRILYAFEQIKKKLQLEVYNPKFAEILVQKRINDRFFVQTNNKQIENAPSGTIINTGIVSGSDFFDYYMVAQKINKDKTNEQIFTATPTHYRVIYNSTSLTEDQFFELTYNQCFNYYNWQGAIKIPAVVKYADRIAYFYGNYLNKESNQELFNSLYYI